MANVEDLVYSNISVPRTVLSLSHIETSHLLQLNISDITLVKVDWATIKHCDPILFVLK